MTSKFEDRKGIFDGVEKTAFFSKPVLVICRENDLPELFQRVDGLDDHRLLAVVTALLIENRLDKILKLLLPKYSKLTDQTAFTFSMKIRMLEAFNLIPQQLLEAAHILRKIRNEFAHNLEITTFDQIGSKFQKSLKNFRNKAYKNREKTEQYEQANSDLHHSFKQVSFYCIAGLDVYQPNIDEFNSIIRSESLHNQIYINANKLQDEITQKILGMTPGEVHTIGDYTIHKITDEKSTVSKF